MTRRLVSFSIGLAASAMLSIPAHAALIAATFQGTITSGPNSGMSVTAVINYDSSQGTKTSYLDETTFTATGGERADVTIGGTVIHSLGSNLTITNVNNPSVNTSSTSFIFGGTNGFIDASLVENPSETPGAPGLDIPNSFDTYYSASGIGTGELNFGTYETVTYTSVTVGPGTPIAVTPLPTAAPMFAAALLSLAGVGYAARRKAKITA